VTYHALRACSGLRRLIEPLKSVDWEPIYHLGHVQGGRSEVGSESKGVDVRMTTTCGAEYRRVPFPMMNASLPRQLWPIDRWWQDE
jgi:hypothetical protein